MSINYYDERFRELGKLINPAISDPEPQEHPVTELLTQEHPIIDRRPKLHKERQLYLHPHYNKLYGTLRTDGGWRYESINYAKGTLTTVAGSTVTAQVNLVLTPNLRLSQWPGAVQAYYVIQNFFFTSQGTTITTQGCNETIFISSGGYVVPMGEIQNSAQYNQGGLDYIIPDAIVDPAITNLGQLSVTLTAGATTATYNWMLGFSVAYLLPELRPYETEEKGMEFDKNGHVVESHYEHH